ncbi:MAG: hypothetical protein ONB46_19865 [candidate division KSB1 bacterium]|nr:hypothetical protein [candidate division KSB1 bacterium]MDZ7368137.1 hypothetical protein [candidate division KSB1 bacterium]MDZ7405815.1 hypothetical protein [candidate division KSB1 bacterium]
MRKIIFILCSTVPLALFAQYDAKEIAKEVKEQSLAAPAGILGVKDRAGGTHNKSNIGLFFENRGKLYPRRLSQGPSGEYPIGSGRHYIYRINPFVGVPGNVVQGRFTTNEEWEAVGGYHNPALAQIAFSDRPQTWPASGWPVKDQDGNPIFRSDQDSYCVYSDSNNTRAILGLEVHQTGYAYGVKFASDMIFFKFDIINKGTKRLDSLYFAMYMDIDAGNVPGGDPEWADEKIGFDQELQLMYDYDADNYTSEWPGNIPGEMGVVFLRTPKVNGKELGITDLHWFLYDDFNVLDVDTVQYGIMSSARSLFNSAVGAKFFHPGANAPNLHFDDLTTQDPGGNDTDAIASSGPYSLNIGDTLTFITAIVAGADHNQLLANTKIAHTIVDLDFAVARPPDPPKLSAVPGDRRVTLYWDDNAERSRDKFSNQFDFEGYRIYRSLDKGATWDQIDRNAVPTAGPDPVPLVEFDKIDGIGKDTGLQYSFVDTTVINGLEYWYSITAYDRGDSSVESLESPRGSNLEVPNIVAVVPRQEAIGRTPPQTTSVRQIGSGNSNYRFVITATDQASVAGKTYTVEFAPLATVAHGNLASVIEVTIADLNATTTKSYLLKFAAKDLLVLLDAATGEVLQKNLAYVSGTPFTFEGLRVTINDADPTVPLDFFPEAGDVIWIGRGVQVFAGSELVMRLRRLEFAKPYATTNGLIFSIVPPAANPQPITYKDRFEFTTTTATVSAEAVKNELHRVRVVPNPYVVASRFEEEFGQLRREPIRQLKFIHLPPTCTIDIFTLDGDLIQTLKHDDGTGAATWDLRTSAGREISSGVYFYLVRTDNAQKLDRFAVIK